MRSCETITRRRVTSILHENFWNMHYKKRAVWAGKYFPFPLATKWVGNLAAEKSVVKFKCGNMTLTTRQIPEDVDTTSHKAKICLIWSWCEETADERIKRLEMPSQSKWRLLRLLIVPPDETIHVMVMVRNLASGIWYFNYNIRCDKPNWLTGPSRCWLYLYEYHVQPQRDI